MYLCTGILIRYAYYPQKYKQTYKTTITSNMRKAKIFAAMLMAMSSLGAFAQHQFMSTGDMSKLVCTLKPRCGALHTRFDNYIPHNE